MKTLGKFALFFGTMVASYFAFKYMFSSAELALLVLISVLLHEVGHAVMGIVMGFEITGMFFVPFLGAAVSIKPESLAKGTDLQKALTYLAGPVMNFILVAVGLVFMRNGYIPYNQALGLVVINLSLGYFNLIPIKVFDGGRITGEIFDSLNNENDLKFERLVRILAIFCGAILLISGKSYFLVLLIIFSIHTRNTEDDPEDAYAPTAMSPGASKILQWVFCILLFGGFIANAFTPSISELF